MRALAATEARARPEPRTARRFVRLVRVGATRAAKPQRGSGPARVAAARVGLACEEAARGGPLARQR